MPVTSGVVARPEVNESLNQPLNDACRNTNDLERIKTLVADGADLLYPDSTSFLASMHVLLNAPRNKNALQLASQNAKGEIKDEIRRAWYWQTN